jgi:hypothetical protein
MPVPEYKGASGSKSNPSAEELARRDGRYAGGSRSIDISYGDVRSVDDRMVVDLEESAKEAAKKAMEPIRATYESSVSDGSLAGQLDAMARGKAQIREGWEYAISDGMTAAIRGGGKGLMQWLTYQFQLGFSQALAEGLSKVLADTASGGKGNGWAEAVQSIGKVFGIGHNANGTPNWRGGLTWVGERGPELASLPRGTQIVPNHGLAGLSMAAQPLSVHVTPSPYFDVAVTRAAQPLVEQYSLAAAEGGAALAESNMTTKRRTTLGSGRR